MNEKKKLDRDLEEAFHMNAKMKDIESKITFNEPKNYLKFNKLAFTLSTCAVCLLLVGTTIGGYFLGKNSFNQHEENNLVLEDKINEAFAYIETICNRKDRMPFRQFLIENEISLYLYHGKIETDYDETDCYFYQFVFLKNYDYELNLEIRNEENIVYNVNPADYNYLGRIEKEGFNFTKTLEITVLNFDEEILYDKINL